MFQNKILKLVVLILVNCFYLSCKPTAFRSVSSMPSASSSSPIVQTIGCLSNEDLIRGECLAKCATNQTRNAAGVCANNPPPISILCSATQDLLNGVCVAKCATNQTRNSAGVCVNNPPVCNANQDLINGLCVVKCASNQTRNSAGFCVDNPPVCNANQDLLNGLCVAKCAPNQTRNSAGFCVDNPPVCNANQDLLNGLCVAKCATNQTRNSAGVCVNNPPVCNSSQDLINGLCVVKCASNQTRNSAGVCVDNPPVCNSSQDLINGICVAKCATNQTRNSAGVCVNNPVVCSATQDLINGVCVAKCATNQTRNSAGVCVNNPIVCSSTQDLINGVCVAKCASNQTRNSAGFCVDNPPVCNANQDLLNGLCVAKCATNQTRNSAGVCVNNPVVCNSTQDLINGVCVAKCASNQTRDPASVQCRNNTCSNGTINPPSCTDCGSGLHLENGSCAPNSRACSPQPLNSFSGLQQWANNSWGLCTGFSCKPGHFLENGACVKGCEQGNHSWLLPHIGFQLMCSGSFPRLREGQSTTVTSTGANPGSIKLTCVNSGYVFTETPHTINTDWSLYLLKNFRNQPVDISCHNDKLLYANPRLWGSCESSSTALCYTAAGSDTTELAACKSYKVYGDDTGLGSSIITEGKTLGQLFDTRYRIFIKTSKDGFASSHEITADIAAGYGLAFNVNSPAQQGRPPGFSFITRKDMAGHVVKVVLEAKTHLNGAARQTGTYETIFNISANDACSNNYDGRGVANFTIGDNLAGESGSSKVRRGYPWPLH